MPQKGASATERLRPATDKQIAVELEKLRAVFGYEAGAWDTAAPLYMDALSDLPYDLLKEAVADAIRTAGPDSRFPRPGELREFVRLSLDRRREAARLENRPRETDEWPDWLREIWGPLPGGRVERNRWVDMYAKRDVEARARPITAAPGINRIPAEPGDLELQEEPVPEVKEVLLRTQRHLTREEADAALANLAESLGRKPGGNQGEKGRRP